MEEVDKVEKVDEVEEWEKVEEKRRNRMSEILATSSHFSTFSTCVRRVDKRGKISYSTTFENEMNYLIFWTKVHYNRKVNSVRFGLNREVSV